MRDRRAPASLPSSAAFASRSPRSASSRQRTASGVGAGSQRGGRVVVEVVAAVSVVDVVVAMVDVVVAMVDVVVTGSPTPAVLVVEIAVGSEFDLDVLVGVLDIVTSGSLVVVVVTDGSVLVVEVVALVVVVAPEPTNEATYVPPPATGLMVCTCTPPSDQWSKTFAPCGDGAPRVRVTPTMPGVSSGVVTGCPASGSWSPGGSGSRCRFTSVGWRKSSVAPVSPDESVARRMIQ